MKTMRVLLVLLFTLCANAQAQTITHGDGSVLTTSYCYNNIDYSLAGLPAGGTFSGCGIVQRNGVWYFNPLLATQGITIFPYQCTISYTVNGSTGTRLLLIYKPVSIHPPMQDTSTCYGDFVLDAQTLYAGAYTYQWSPALPLDRPDSNHTVGFIAQSQTFVLRVEDLSSGCVGTDTVRVIKHPVPDVQATPAHSTIKARETVSLTATGASAYRWLPSRWLDNDSIANPIAMPQAPLTYLVIGSNEFGCLDSAEVHIGINESLFVPNAFSPNGDGVNDVFKVENVGYQGLELFQVFNRWGNIVYETKDATKGWDGYSKGIAAEIGSYYYLIKLSDRDGEALVFKGEVLLIR